MPDQPVSSVLELFAELPNALLASNEQLADFNRKLKSKGTSFELPLATSSLRIVQPPDCAVSEYVSAASSARRPVALPVSGREILEARLLRPKPGWTVRIALIDGRDADAVVKSVRKALGNDIDLIVCGIVSDDLSRYPAWPSLVTAAEVGAAVFLVCAQ